MIDLYLRDINTLFFLKKAGKNHVTRIFFFGYYMTTVVNRHFIVLFDRKLFLKKKPYEKLVKMTRNIDHRTGNLIDYLYHQKLL